MTRTVRCRTCVLLLLLGLLAPPAFARGGELRVRNLNYELVLVSIDLAQALTRKGEPARAQQDSPGQPCSSQGLGVFLNQEV